MTLSIIIPTLNEAAALPATLENVAALSPQPLEVIVVDAGSEDATVDLALEAGVQVLANLPKGRAGQMNAGAAAARGDQLCFLHADTNVPPDFVSLTERVLADRGTALAAFVSIMRGARGVRRITTAHNFLKTWYAPLLFRPLSFVRGCRLVFGDQVMICRREDFDAIGGFDPDQTIMEEADLCLRMVREGRGRVRQVNRKVWSSDRRVAEWGFWKANATYLYVGMMWGLGAGPKRLSQHYEDVR
ncbi:MAG: TIGR04283 family arsenosugar biosynthesis glycosyltransferase [Henriciella sp.]|nr:TIGR04283 family arsenosugar biosynthesis glycosyltransferase [Henriciella sp.]